MNTVMSVWMLGNGRADRIALAPAVIEDDPAAQAPGKIGRAVLGSAVHHEEVMGLFSNAEDYGFKGFDLVQGGDDNGYLAFEGRGHAFSMVVICRIKGIHRRGYGLPGEQQV